MTAITKKDVHKAVALFKRKNVHFKWVKSLKGLYGCITRYSPDRKSVYYLVEAQSRLPNYIKVAVLAHEHGHYLCDIKKCHCGGVNGVLYSNKKISSIAITEAHAYIYEISYLMENKLWKSLKWAMDVFSSINWNTDIAVLSKHVKSSAAYKKAKIALKKVPQK